MKIDIEKLNIAQANKCLTNKDLCRVAKVGHVTLIEIKNGSEKKPELKNNRKISKGFECRCCRPSGK